MRNATAEAARVYRPGLLDPARDCQKALDEILTNPATVARTLRGGNFAGGPVFISPDGAAAVFSPAGTFELRKDALPVSIHVGIAYPPHRDEGIAEFHVAHDDSIDVPAEIFRADGRLMIALYSRTDGIAWEYELSDFLSAIAAGMRVLDGA